MAKHYIYQFYAELVGYEPKIWRRFELNGEKTVAELSYVVMILFEMQAGHLFKLRRNFKTELIRGLKKEFTEEEIEKYIENNKEMSLLKNISYELVNDEIDNFLEEGERLEVADEVTINREFSHTGIELFFEYDFGDSWEVKLSLEAFEKKEVSIATLPRVLEGEGFGIIEDAGGVFGLKRISTILSDSSHDEYEDTIEWLDTDGLDLIAFDSEDMNFRLKKLIRIFKDIYEFEVESTQKSLNILLRDYQEKGSRGY